MYNKEAFVQPGWAWFRIMGRLTPGTTRRQLQQRLQPSFHIFNEQMIGRFPTMPPAIQKQFRDMLLRVHPGARGASQFRKEFARPLWIVLGVAAGILLIACANVASLLLARATVRSPEMAMRLSLGAGRSRLIRQLLTESLLLSAITGAAGWLLASGIAPGLVSVLSTRDEPVQLALSIDTRVLLFCAAITTLTTLLFGLLPAWQAARVDPMRVLRRASGQSSKLRWGYFFVSVQVAFAFCLVMTGASFLFSLRNLRAVKTGFDAQGVAVLSMVDKAQPEPARRTLMTQLQTRLSETSGVEAAAIAPWAVFAHSWWSEQIIVPGKRPSEREETFYNISPRYFRTLRTPLLEGRDFDRRDSMDEDPIPTIVNRTFERKYFGGNNALGRTFGRPEKQKIKRHVIVGIAADANYGDLRHTPDAIVYVPLAGRNDFVVYVRSQMQLGTLIRLAGKQAQALGSGMRVYEATTLDTLVGDTILKEKLLAGIGGVFAGLGLLLAAIGLSGLLNYTVVQRTKELGIRGALGAQRSELIGLVFRDLMGMLASGLAVGVAGSLALLVVLRSLLFGLKPVDPTVLATALGVFVLAAVLAGGIPAARAAAVDPMVALRQE